MAVTYDDTHPSRTGRAGDRHHGQAPLAGIVPLRPEFGSRGGGARMVSKIAQVFASMRDQATSGGAPSRPPPAPGPCLRLLTNTASPDDAA